MSTYRYVIHDGITGVRFIPGQPASVEQLLKDGRWVKYPVDAGVFVYEGMRSTEEEVREMVANRPASCEPNL